MKILIAEDDPIIVDGLTHSLKQSGYAVDSVQTGGEAITAIMNHSFDLIILDLGLPKYSGVEVLARLRASNTLTPVLILTADSAIEQRVRCLDLGADDFMVKPFALSELEARVRALIRRGMSGGSAQIRHERLTFDQIGKVAYCESRLIDLSSREIALLEILLQRVGRLVSKEQLIEHLCSWGEEVSHNAIEVYIHRLRRKVEEAGVKIITVRGLGYCLERATTSI